MKIIKKAEYRTAVEFSRDFIRKDGSGFTFPCREDGELLPTVNEIGRENYAKYLSGEYDVVDEGIIRREHSWKEPAVGLCDCGEEVELYGFTNTCMNCGADYNWNGHRLAPRSQWGEETGETAADILRIK